MSKQERNFYCKVGQAIYNIVGALMFVGVSILASMLVGYIASIL